MEDKNTQILRKVEMKNEYFKRRLVSELKVYSTRDFTNIEKPDTLIEEKYRIFIVIYYKMKICSGVWQ